MILQSGPLQAVPRIAVARDGITTRLSSRTEARQRQAESFKCGLSGPMAAVLKDHRKMLLEHFRRGYGFQFARHRQEVLYSRADDEPGVAPVLRRDRSKRSLFRLS